MFSAECLPLSAFHPPPAGSTHWSLAGSGKRKTFSGKHLCWFTQTHEQSSWSKGIPETNLKLYIPCSECMQQWCDQPITGRCLNHRQTHACIAPWCHRPMHADTAWVLRFRVCLGYTFTPATLVMRLFHPLNSLVVTRNLCQISLSRIWYFSNLVKHTSKNSKMARIPNLCIFFLASVVAELLASLWFFTK